jgi:hypothetical protein
MVARLEAYRQDRKLAACVRELLEHALTCPYERQTRAEASTPQQPPCRRKRQAAHAD